jgi:hypothetical protein
MAQTPGNGSQIICLQPSGLCTIISISYDWLDWQRFQQVKFSDRKFGDGIMELFGSLVIAAIIGILIGRDASARGMSGIGWGLFSFCICIVAVPIYLIVRKPRIE